MSGEEKKKHGPDAEQVKEILAVVSEKVPALLNSLADVLYGKEQGAKYGQAVSGFYKSLKDAGMTDEQAYELTKQYMSAMNLGGLIGEAMRGGKREGRGINIQVVDKDKDDDDTDEE